jgi:KR domain/Phosphopantetheine attachment site
MTFDQWQLAILPKVQGTWNLHEALQARKEPLDFFFLFGSISGLGGQWRQSNYASANTFLNAFVQYRHSLGLPASILDIGLMGDVGYLTRNDNILEALRATSLYVLHEQEFLDSLELMISRSHPQSIPATSPPLSNRRYVNPSQVAIGLRSMLPLSSPNNRTVWRNDPRISVYNNSEFQHTTACPATNENLKQFLRDGSANPRLLESEESVAFLSKEIGATLLEFMMGGKEGALDLTAPLVTLGVDSLISVELRNWFKQRVGCEFTVLEIVGSENITQLGRQARAKLLEKFKARA